jgi:cyclopropane fatty-acyl-phospholipid synthase-like methyltransferase
MFTQQDIARYYDLSEVHYRLFWQLEKAHSLHYGYWDASTRNFREALLNINKVLADLAGISEGESVLDAGCGVGGSSVWLARERKCQVTGISINANQVRKASELAREAGVINRVRFEQKDYLSTSYPDNSFDVVWAIESVCHADDKSRFLKEAFRVLKKGGRLILADFFKAGDLHGKNAEAINRWAHGWAINDFATSEDFYHQSLQAGFHEVQVQDASHAILPSARRLYRSYFIGKPAAVLYRLFKGKVTSLSKNNVDTAYWQYRTLKKGLWSYKIVRALKNEH